MLPTEGGEHFFEKCLIFVEKVAWSMKGTKKIVDRTRICKIRGAMHTLIFADGALEAKNAQVMGHNQNFEGGTERKKSEPNEPRGDKSEQK